MTPLGSCECEGRLIHEQLTFPQQLGVVSGYLTFNRQVDTCFPFRIPNSEVKGALRNLGKTF